MSVRSRDVAADAGWQRAVEAALRHPYAGKYSSNQIAQHVGVSHTFVDNIRSILQPLQDTPRTVTRNGTTYEMNTAAIGKSSNGHISAPTPITTSTVSPPSPHTAAPSLVVTNPPMPISEPELEVPEEPELHYDPSAQVAFCEICQALHGDWAVVEGDTWECSRCQRQVDDAALPVAEEPEPEAAFNPLCALLPSA